MIKLNNKTNSDQLFLDKYTQKITVVTKTNFSLLTVSVLQYAALNHDIKQVVRMLIHNISKPSEMCNML